MRLFLFALATITLSIVSVPAQTVQKWEPGMLDIHHINTGRGEARFCILPDGTTMLIDAGEMNANGEAIGSIRRVKIHPDST